MTNDKQRERLKTILENHCAVAECKAHSQDCTAEDCASCLADAILADGWMRPPCKVGDTAYFLIEDTVAGKKYISPEPTVDVCTKGFYTSGHADSDENGDLWLWSDIGKLESLKKLIRDKESELREQEFKYPDLSDFSTTQLKAELRRRKRERRGYM